MKKRIRVILDTTYRPTYNKKVMSNSPSPLISIIIPAYNEAPRIKQAIHRVEQLSLPWKKEIIVVNDGSRDGTREILERYKERVRVIHHERNQGVGAALCTGFSAATGDILVRQDSDLEYPPEEMHFMIAPILERRTDVVYGFRGKRDYTPTTIRRYHWGGVVVNTTCKLLYGFEVKDFITAAKALRREVFVSMNLTSPGFEIESEITAKTVRMEYTLLCIPYSYKPRSFEEGKKIRWHHALPILWGLVYWRFANMPSKK